MIPERSHRHGLWWLLLALMGLSLLDAIWLHILQRDLVTFARACHLAPGLDCAPALASRYGKFFGIPLSSFAVASYLLMAATALQGLIRDDVRDRNAFFLALLLAVSTAFCAYLAWISFTVLSAYCPYCLILHLLTPIMLVVALLLLARRRTPLRDIVFSETESIRNNRLVQAGIALVLVIVMGGLPMYERYARQRMLDAQPLYRLVLEGDYPRLVKLAEMVADRPSLGPMNAKVTIIEFADFLCPACRESRPELDALVKEYGVHYIFVPHPRSSECNPLSETLRPGACLGALALEYTVGTDRYWRVHDELFRDDSYLSEEGAVRLAALVGVPSITAVTSDSAAALRLMRDFEIAAFAGVSHTPSLFINGMGIEGMPDEWFLREVIEKEMGRR